LGYDVRD
jgi:hypothetical protein